MAGDPNARRDKALESIARELANIAHESKRTNNWLSQIERNTRRPQPERPDPFDVPQEESTEGPQTPSGVSSANAEGLRFPQSSNPYFKRSDGTETPPFGEGPYGMGTSQPYS